MGLALLAGDSEDPLLSVHHHVHLVVDGVLVNLVAELGMRVLEGLSERTQFLESSAIGRDPFVEGLRPPEVASVLVVLLVAVGVQGAEANLVNRDLRALHVLSVLAMDLVLNR